MKLFLSDNSYVRLYIDKLYGIYKDSDTSIKPMGFIALTLTISPDSWQRQFKKCLHTVMCYFTYMVKELGYDSDHSFGIIEWTKKGVPHMHSICRLGTNDLGGDQYLCTEKVSKHNGKWTTKKYFKDSRIDVEHYLEPIYHGHHLKAVLRYITKTLPPLSIATFLEKHTLGE